MENTLERVHKDTHGERGWEQRGEGARRGQVYQRDHTVGGEKTNGGIYPEGRGRRGRGEGVEGREARQQH